MASFHLRAKDHRLSHPLEGHDGRLSTHSSSRPLSLRFSDADPPWDVKPVLDGAIDQLPPITSRLVRVFLSSTFSDMIPERNALMEHVYPKLKDFCRQQYRLEFQIMDLRWGIRDQSQDDHTTVEFCIREIDNCKKLSLGPNFVALIGQKYGYRPFPSQIRAVEFETIRGEVASTETGREGAELLDKWFKKNTNVVPHVYSLQPISSILPYYNDKVVID